MYIVTGSYFTARDAAHKRMDEVLSEGKELPLDIKNQMIIIWDHLRREKEDRSAQQDRQQQAGWTNMHHAFMDLGLGGMIGKGKRSQAVQDAIVRNKAVYFAAVGGAGALLSKCIKRADVIAYDDLGTEAIRRLEIEDLPAIVVIDSEGNNLYETAVKEYAEE